MPDVSIKKDSSNEEVSGTKMSEPRPNIANLPLSSGPPLGGDHLAFTAVSLVRFGWDSTLEIYFGNKRQADKHASLQFSLISRFSSKQKDQCLLARPLSATSTNPIPEIASKLHKVTNIPLPKHRSSQGISMQRLSMMSLSSRLISQICNVKYQTIGVYRSIRTTVFRNYVSDWQS